MRWRGRTQEEKKAKEEKDEKDEKEPLESRDAFSSGLGRKKATITRQCT